MTIKSYTMPDTAFVDAGRERLFALVGEQRSPFRGITEWPWLHELLQNESQRILTEEGEEVWKAAGGFKNKAGENTLYAWGDATENILKKAEREVGGILYHHGKRGRSYAAKLQTVWHNGKRSRVAYGISWGNRPPEGLDPAARRGAMEKAHEIWDPENNERHRRMLADLADDIRLYQQAEQILWLIHAQVLAQRKSMIMIPPTVMAEVLWGHREKWPQNWKRDVDDALACLTSMHSYVIELGKGWVRKPQWSYSVALAHVSHIAKDSDDEWNACPQGCPLHGEAAHDHYRIQTGYGFLGVLEEYLTREDRIEWPVGEDGEPSLRYYDFSKMPETKSRKEAIQEKRKAGQIVPVNLPNKMHSPAAWSPLGDRERRILDGIRREISRAPKSRDEWEISNAQVVGTQPGKMVRCPVLDSAQKFKVAGGNGHSRGMGYQIAGSKWTGWLIRSGYDAGGKPDAEIRPMVRDWLNGLETLQGVLPIVPAGIDKSGNWYDLAEMKRLAGSQTGFAKLDKIRVRIYLPADYEERIRELFQRAGGWTSDQNADVENPEIEITSRLKELRLGHQDLADCLEISRSYASHLINGRRKWSAERVQQARQWLANIADRCD